MTKPAPELNTKALKTIAERFSQDFERASSTTTVQDRELLKLISLTIANQERQDTEIAALKKQVKALTPGAYH